MAVDFFAAVFFAADFFATTGSAGTFTEAGAFLAADFFADVFLAVDFSAVTLLAGAFLPWPFDRRFFHGGFLRGNFLDVVFWAAGDFLVADRLRHTAGPSFMTDA